VRRGWSIEKHRVELEINALVLTVQVDRVSPAAVSTRSNLLGAWSIPVGERSVILRRVRSLDVARNELWVDGVKIPPSTAPIPWIAARVGAPCKVHPSIAASSLVPAATIECGACRTPVCPTCCAVDGVRCRECFTRADEEMRKQDRANRLKGPLITVALIGALALYGWLAHSRAFLECAAGLTALIAFLLVRGLIRERMDERALPIVGESEARRSRK